MPSFEELPAGCRFSDRCPLADEGCRRREQENVELSPGHWVRCGKCRELVKRDA